MCWDPKLCQIWFTNHWPHLSVFRCFSHKIARLYGILILLKLNKPADSLDAFRTEKHGKEGDTDMLVIS